MAITTDLVSYWPLEASGNDAIGPYNPSAITGVSFVTDGALQVSEFSSGQIRYDPAMIDGITTNFTFQAWVKLTTLPTGGSYLLTNAYSGATYPSVQVYIFDTGVVRFQFYTSNTAGGAQTLDGPTLSTGTWYHLAFTYDGSTMTIFQNGSSVATLSTSGSPFTNGYSVSVGSYRPYASGYFVDGRAWDMALWHRALTAAEVLQIYNAGAANNRLSSLFPMTANLVSYWQWESGLTDTMGTYNGTIGGAGSLSYVASMTGFGQCMDLTPSKYVTFGTVSAYGAGSFSVSCWFNSDVATSGAYYTILGQSDGSNLGFNIFTDTAKSGRIRFEIGTDGVNWRSIWSTNVPSTSTWYHLVVVVDRSTNSAQMYIDGVLQSHASDTGAAAGSLSVVGTIGTKLNYWCAADVVGWNQWDGKIDDCAIRALTAGEALQIYNAGAAGNTLSSLFPMTANLVSYWPFDSSTNDAFGSDNGTGTGGLAYATSMSGFSNAIDCSGSDYVTFGAPAYGTNSLTFSYWVKPAALGAGKYQIIGDNRTGSYVGISIFCNGPNDYFRCELSSGAGYSNTYSTSVPVAGTWYHLVIVVDKSTNTQRMYVDGVLQSNASDSPSIAGYGSLTNSTYYIGTASTAGISIWEGLIDDAAWWTRALTPAEIIDIYNAGAAGSPLSSFIPADADLMGQFSSVVHSVAAADADLSGQFASIVHSVAAQNADLSGQFASIVHSSTAATRADLEGQFASIVHSVAAANADLSGQFVSVVHSSTAAPSGGGGPPGQGGSLQGYLLQGGVLEGDF